MNVYVKDEKKGVKVDIENIDEKDFGEIWKEINAKVDIGKKIRGDELINTIRKVIDDFCFEVIPDDEALDRERYNTLISPKVGGGSDDFEAIAEKHIKFEPEEYDAYWTVELATMIACEYMWKRSKAV